jgi:hypothetical protein
MRKKFGKTSEAMEGFCFVRSTTGHKWHKTGRNDEHDNDDNGDGDDNDNDHIHKRC